MSRHEGVSVGVLLGEVLVCPSWLLPTPPPRATRLHARDVGWRGVPHAGPGDGSPAQQPEGEELGVHLLLSWSSPCSSARHDVWGLPLLGGAPGTHTGGPSGGGPLSGGASPAVGTSALDGSGTARGQGAGGEGEVGRQTATVQQASVWRWLGSSCFGANELLVYLHVVHMQGPVQQVNTWSSC